MVIDTASRKVTVGHRPVELTGKEFDLLLFLVSNKGRLFTKKQIYTQVWAEEYAFDDSNIMLRNLYPITALFNFSGYQITSSQNVAISIAVLVLCAVVSGFMLKNQNRRV